jgi:phospholipid-binding lipoprotein MlaA
VGPSSIRDTIGWAGDIVVDPFFSFEKDQIYWGFLGLRIVDRRADRLAVGEIIEDASVDPNVLLRDTFIQRRRNLVYDGNPPPEEGEEDIWKDVDFGTGTGTGPDPGDATPPAQPQASPDTSADQAR